MSGLVGIALWLLALVVLVFVVAVWHRQRELAIRTQHELALRRLELERPQPNGAPPLYETAPAIVMERGDAPRVTALHFEAATKPPVKLAVVEPVKRSCADCRHFNLEAGQHIMAGNPAFQAATRAIPPWRMGRVLKQRPNPKRAELIQARQAILDAVAAQGGVSDDAQARTLHGLDLELLNTPDTVPAPDEEQVGPELLHATWADMGACAKNEELRMRFDACEAFTSRS